MPEINATENPQRRRIDAGLGVDADSLDRALAALPQAGLPEGFVLRTSEIIRAEARAGRLRPPTVARAGGMQRALPLSYLRRLARRALLPDLGSYLDIVLASCLGLTSAAGMGLAAWALSRADPLWAAELSARLQPAGQELLLMLRLPGGLGYLALLCLASLAAALALSDQRSALLR